MFANGDASLRMHILRGIAFLEPTKLETSPSKEETQNPLASIFTYRTASVAMQNLIMQASPAEAAFISNQIARTVVEIVREKFGFYVVQKLLKTCNGPGLGQLFKAMCNSAGVLCSFTCMELM